MNNDELEDLAQYLSATLDEEENADVVFEDMELNGAEIKWIRDQIYWTLHSGADKGDE